MAKKTTKKNAPTEATAPSAEQKKKALETALAQIRKNNGEGSIIRLGDAPDIKISAVSTGSLTLDLALGVGGLPKGRIIEIYGPESSGKTTIALHAIAESQKQGGTAAFIDAEHALDPVYAKAIGVNTDDLLVSQPDNGEQALEIAEALINSGAVDIIVIDSVAALVPQQEIEGGMGDSHMGVQARLMSQALRKLAGAINKTNCILIFINQLRSKIGVMYGNPETTTGGNALKFYASVRIDIRKSETLKNGSDAYGNRVKAKVVKNKVAPPFRIAEFDILYGIGISKSTEVIDLAIELGIVEKSGSFFTYGDTKIQGKDKTRAYFEANPELMDELEAKIKAKLANMDDGDAPSGDDDDFGVGEDFDLSDLGLD
ncbi:MAG: recombinase RecA [Clostridia bacterium]|nr:recombinase RecA [Clostridia bacterium]